MTAAGWKARASALSLAVLGAVVLFAPAAKGADALPASTWSLQDAWGSERLKLSGSFRSRYETIAGQPRAALRASDELISLRTTVFGEYRFGQLRLGGELYDSRAYLAGTDSPLSTSEVNAVEIVQAYVGLDLTQPVETIDSLNLQAGRLLMNVGSRRLIAFDDYRNTVNSFTGTRGIAKLRGGYSLDAFYVLPQLRLPDGRAALRANDIRMDRESSAAVLYGAVLTGPRRLARGALELGFIGFREKDASGRPTRDRDLKTFDVRYVREPAPGTWDLEVELASQYGQARTGTVVAAPLRDVAAGFAHLRFGYQWNAAAKPRLAFDYDWASGEGRGTRSQRFDTLFGMRRADLAPSGLYNLVGRANLASPGLRLELVPTSRLDGQVTYRGLWLASATDAFSTLGIRDATGRSGDFAGQQVDTRLRYWLVPRMLRLELNGLLLLKGRFLREAPGVRDNGNVRFVAASVQATF